MDQDDLCKATKMLKNNKSRDPNDLINELFKEPYAGRDLYEALLMMFNQIKETKQFPDFMNKSNICSISKKKNSKHHIENERGLFLLTTFKKIFENLLFNSLYEDIDRHMSESNVGARKKRNLKDHILVMNGVINAAAKGKEESIEIQIWDLEKAFDSLWLLDCCNDAYDSLEESNRTDELNVLNKMNEKNLMSVKTNHEGT